jgi:hypothetical protein
VEFVILTQEWVDENISPAFQTMLKELRNEQHSGYVLIPEGANEEHDATQLAFVDGAPVTVFCNKDRKENDRRCVLDSAASGLAYLGHSSLAFFCSSNISDLSKQFNGMDYFEYVVNEKCTKEERSLFQLIKLNYKRLKKWDTVRDVPNYRLCLLGIASSDCKTDHAICVVGKWIFDSNLEKALPLSKESLDICASSAERESVFVKVTRGIVLQDRY